MKRAALLLFFAGAPLLLVLFPRLRRAFFRRARLFLLLWVGAILFTGFAVGLRSDRAAALSGGEALFAGIGLVLIVSAFAAVARDALRDRSTRG
jgi:hypothetical protein